MKNELLIVVLMGLSGLAASCAETPEMKAKRDFDKRYYDAFNNPKTFGNYSEAERRELQMDLLERDGSPQVAQQIRERRRIKAERTQQEHEAESQRQAAANAEESKWKNARIELNKKDADRISKLPFKFVSTNLGVADIIHRGLAPSKEFLYTLAMLRVMQRVDGGYLVHIDPQLAGPGGSGVAFLASSREFYENALLTGYASYAGPFQYRAVLGTEKTVPAFKDYTEDFHVFQRRPYSSP